MKKWIVVVSVLTTTLSRGDTIVVPNQYANVDAPESGVVPSFGFRYQEVFDASGFLNTPSGGISITAFSWRHDNPPGGGANFDLTFPSAEVLASTTSRNSTSLSSVFSDNIGLDETVTRAAAPLHISGVPSLDGPAAFSVTFAFDTPFKYDPSKGNLLLEVNVVGGGVSPGNLDYSNSAAREGIGLVQSPNRPFPPLLNGPITQFTYGAIPEPRIWQLVIAAASVLFLKRRLTQ